MMYTIKHVPVSHRKDCGGEIEGVFLFYDICIIEIKLSYKKCKRKRPKKLISLILINSLGNSQGSNVTCAELHYEKEKSKSNI